MNFEYKNLEYRNLEFSEYYKIIKLWNDNLGCLFPMDDKLFFQNLKMDTNFNPKYVIGACNGDELLGFIIYKQHGTNSGLLPPDRSIGNINSLIVDFKYRNMGIGTKLLSLCEKELKKVGVNHIEAGRDTFHFLPGVPTECVETLKFLQNRDFKEEYISRDLICDIKNIEIEEIKNSRELKINCDNRFVIQELTKKYENSLMEFFKNTFPGRWYGDINIFLNYGMDYRDIIIVIDKNKDKVIGFSHIFDKYSKVIGPSIYWRKLLGETFGGLGPIGIDNEYRKLGLGLTLLYKCIEIQKNRGVSKMCIDWTELLDFYGIFNFIPWKNYIHMNKKI